MSVFSLSSAPGRLVPVPDSVSRGSGRSFSRSELAGRLAELSSWGGGARLTLAFDLILQAQTEGRATAWIAVGRSMFFPPDAARCGVDLEAMPIVRVPDARAAARAADKLVRSGAFDLVVAPNPSPPAVTASGARCQA
jgi:RecA/RadA recombinase